MSAEDFSFMLQKKPGAYVLLGQGAMGHLSPIHTAEYSFNDDLLPIGAAFFIELLRERVNLRT